MIKSISVFFFLLLILNFNNTAIAGKGVIDGNGGDDVRRAQIPFPDKLPFLNVLETFQVYEPALAGLLHQAVDGPDSLISMEYPTRCSSDNGANVYRAYYKREIKAIVFCRDFFEKNLLVDRLATIFHELLHHIIDLLGTELGSGEEDAVQAMEQWFGLFASDPRGDDARYAILALRKLLDLYLPELLIIAQEYDLVGPFKAIPLFKDPSIGIKYPLPLSLGIDPTIPVHHGEYQANLLWTTDPQFQLKGNIPKEILSPCKPGIYKGTRRFSYINGYGVANYFDRSRGQHGTVNFDLYCVDRSLLSEEFSAALDSGAIPDRTIRSVAIPKDYPRATLQNIVIYFP